MIKNLIISLVLLSSYTMAMAMEMDDTSELTPPHIVGAGGKTFHWLLTIFFLFLLPSVSTVFAFASKVHSVLTFQLLTFVYSILEAVILRFPDGDGHENRVSRGTAWFLVGLCGFNFCFTLMATRRHAESKLHHALGGTLMAQTFTGWFKSCIAPVAMFGFCQDVHTGQCLAHGLMGTAFILYGFVYLMVLLIPKFSKADYSQDYIDSWVMCIWGIFNTFTEHRWGREPWNHGDYQHTAMGIIWACGGFVGILLARNKKRTFVPSLLIIFTGWAMSQHAQHLVISTKIHYLFGLILMVGGACRIIEISFLLRDSNVIDEIQSFQYLAPFCLVCAGIMFMSANEEQLVLVLRLSADHSSYGLVIISAAFIVYLWMLLCLNFYNRIVTKNEHGFLKSYEEADFELNEMVNEDSEPLSN